jgi:hypothetical protein
LDKKLLTFWKLCHKYSNKESDYTVLVLASWTNETSS